jgi:DHA1 family bicyclomycin/chloramphenicol resistance-like MFS transporter
MLSASVVNVVANALATAHVGWALIPIGLFAFGWSLMVPAITLMALDLFPERRGMASSLQAVIGSVANGIVAGVIAPLLMHSTLWLAFGSLAMMLVGLGAWLALRAGWRETINARENMPLERP